MVDLPACGGVVDLASVIAALNAPAFPVVAASFGLFCDRASEVVEPALRLSSILISSSSKMHHRLSLVHRASVRYELSSRAFHSNVMISDRTLSYC
jgi:hypothetical protein